MIPGICKTWPIGNDLSGPEACGPAVMIFFVALNLSCLAVFWKTRSGVTNFSSALWHVLVVGSLQAAKQLLEIQTEELLETFLLLPRI